MTVVLQAVFHILDDHELEEVVFFVGGAGGFADLEAVGAVGVLRHGLVVVYFVELVPQCHQWIIPIEDFFHLAKPLLLQIGLSHDPCGCPLIFRFSRL